MSEESRTAAAHEQRVAVLDRMQHDEWCDWTTIGECACSAGQALISLLASERAAKGAASEPRHMGVAHAQDTLRAYLRAGSHEPPSGTREQGLDVERLAQAVHVALEHHGHDDVTECVAGFLDQRYAKAIAAAYATSQEASRDE